MNSADLQVSEKTPIIDYMTIREQIIERIQGLDETMLSDLLRELDFLEKQRDNDFPDDFLNLINNGSESNLSEEEASELASRVVQADRQISRN